MSCSPPVARMSVITGETSSVPEASEEQITIEPLGEEWTDLLAGAWKFSDDLTKHMLRTLIKLRRVFGVFIPSIREPVSWMCIFR